MAVRMGVVESRLDDHLEQSKERHVEIVKKMDGYESSIKDLNDFRLMLKTHIEWIQKIFSPKFLFPYAMITAYPMLSDVLSKIYHFFIH